MVDGAKALSQSSGNAVRLAVGSVCLGVCVRQSEPLSDKSEAAATWQQKSFGTMPRSRSPSRGGSRSPRRGDKRRDTTPMRREAPSRCSLLVRGLSKACRLSVVLPCRVCYLQAVPSKSSMSCRSEDLRYEAERYGPCRDVYCPRDYYTGSVLFCLCCNLSVPAILTFARHLTVCCAQRGSRSWFH